VDNNKRNNQIMRRKPCRLYGWRHRCRSNTSNPHSPSHTPKQPINTTQRQPSPLMGWGLSLHMQLNPKKNFRAPSARTIIATLRSRPLTSLRSARATGSLRSPKRIRYAHTTQPHHLAHARASHSLRSHNATTRI